MKKTLIALAVAVTPVVSGSAMAWDTDGTGGIMKFSGTVTALSTTPWEVKVGDAVTDLNAQIEAGQKEVFVTVNKAIPVLGIRTQVGNTGIFGGGPGLAPRIDFGGKVDLDGFSNSVTTLTLDVMDDEGTKKIGSFSAPLFAAGQSSYRVGSVGGKKALIASADGDAFLGGLAKSAAQIDQNNGYQRVEAISAEFTSHFNDQSVQRIDAPGGETFSNTTTTFSGYYGSGIEAGSQIQITLDNPASSDDIQWKASLPVTVSYQ